MNTTTAQQQTIHPNEYEQASNSYLTAIVAVIAGLPLPIVNLIAAIIFYFGKSKSSYFIRWHSIQAVLAQLVLVPFNSIAWAWTVAMFFRLGNFVEHPQNRDSSIWPYVIYIFIIVLFNIFEFIAVLITASKVRNGENVRWFLIAGITDRLCSKEKRDIYNI